MQPQYRLDTPPDSRFSLLLDPADGRSTVAIRVILAGELDALSADPLTETVVDILHLRRPQRVEINLAGVTFLDSAGIKALLRCHADAQEADCRVTLTAPRSGIRRVLEITGLLEHFGVREPPPPRAD